MPTPSPPSTPLTSPTILVLILLPLALSILATLSATKYLLPLPLTTLTPIVPPSTLSARLTSLLWTSFHPLTTQLAPTNSVELLIGAVLAWRVRGLERLWGARKWLSFVLGIWILVGGVWGSVQAVGWIGGLLLRSWAGNKGGVGHEDTAAPPWLYVPSGPTAVIFALLAAWGEEVPRLWRWQVLISLPGPAQRTFNTNTTQDTTDPFPPSSTSQRPRPSTSPSTTHPSKQEVPLTLSSHSPTYLLALQLSLTQFPYTIPPALLGYVLGTAWTAGLLPGKLTAWRVPAWVVGEKVERVVGARGGGRGGESVAGGFEGEEEEGYESLRRRLGEEERLRTGNGDGSATGRRSVDQTRRRLPLGMGTRAQIAEYFRGVF